MPVESLTTSAASTMGFAVVHDNASTDLKFVTVFVMS